MRNNSTFGTSDYPLQGLSGLQGKQNTSNSAGSPTSHLAGFLKLLEASMYQTILLRTRIEVLVSMVQERSPLGLRGLRGPKSSIFLRGKVRSSKKMLYSLGSLLLARSIVWLCGFDLFPAAGWFFSSVCYTFVAFCRLFALFLYNLYTHFPLIRSFVKHCVCCCWSMAEGCDVQVPP